MSTNQVDLNPITKHSDSAALTNLSTKTQIPRIREIFDEPEVTIINLD